MRIPTYIQLLAIEAQPSDKRSMAHCRFIYSWWDGIPVITRTMVEEGVMGVGGRMTVRSRTERGGSR